MKGLCPVLLVFAVTAGVAQDWSGPFALIPVSAPELVLEVVSPGTDEGGAVSINAPGNGARQEWIMTRRDAGYALSPASSPSCVLTVKGGGTNNGTPVVIESDAGQLWQRWSVTNNADGSVSLLAMHAPAKGLDDFGGGDKPGARQDLWDYHPGDEHLHWVLKPLAGATVSPGAAARLNPLAPKGEVKEFTFDSSRLYPGTRRQGAVFIPAQINPLKPACVYVRQDGYNRAEKRLLESLIDCGDMPVTVGVFVKPGSLPAPMPHTLARRNRCLEYDAVDDLYVRFLDEELLPFLAKTLSLNLSTNGNDRCIAGGSSGGIAAFNAAWQRPDAFTRVYANSGSFVAFRGGNTFPTLVRKTEPKPIRAYLTTGTRDMENCAGDWFLIDQEMDKALKFSGYDYRFNVIDGPHVAGWIEHFQEAMRFIWKGWPEPVRAGAGAPRVRDVLLPGEGWTLVADDLDDARGPACNAKGEVLFVDSRADAIRRIGLDGSLSVVVASAGCASAVTVGPSNELYAVSESTGKLERFDPDGRSRRTVAEGVPGRHVIARPDGALYVSGEKLWRVSGGDAVVVDEGLKHASGLAYRPDQWLLAVADGASKWAYSYQIAEDGRLINKERFFCLNVQDWDDDAGAESMCYAHEGQLLVATRAGVQICADDGPAQVILPLPDRSRVFGVCLGGASGDTLYAFGSGRVWKRRVKIHAMGAFTPWAAVRNTPL